MVSSLNIIQDRLSRSRLAGDPPDVAIAPRLGHIGLLEFDRARESIDAAFAASEAALPDIRAGLDTLG
jgi:NTE family protein